MNEQTVRAWGNRYGYSMAESANTLSVPNREKELIDTWGFVEQCAAQEWMANG